jgi:hypothetical protein
LCTSQLAGDWKRRKQGVRVLLAEPKRLFSHRYDLSHSTTQHHQDSISMDVPVDSGIAVQPQPTPNNA